MATYYAIPCPEGLRKNFAVLIHNFEIDIGAPQNQFLFVVEKK